MRKLLFVLLYAILVLSITTGCEETAVTPKPNDPIDAVVESIPGASETEAIQPISDDTKVIAFFGIFKVGDRLFRYRSYGYDWWNTELSELTLTSDGTYVEKATWVHESEPNYWSGDTATKHVFSKNGAIVFASEYEAEVDAIFDGITQAFIGGCYQAGLDPNGDRLHKLAKNRSMNMDDVAVYITSID